MKRNILLAALLVLATGLGRAQEGAIATVNGDRITSADITKKLWWQYSAQGLSEIIDERLLLQEAARLKIPYDAKEADKRFETLAAAYKDKQEFDANLKSVGWTPADVKELIKRQMLIKNTVVTAKAIAFSDADVKASFEANREKLGKAESVKLRQLFVGTQAEADDAYLALSAGANFAKLSALKSTDENLRKKEGDIGTISRGLLLPEIEKEIFALKPGQYTKAIATGNGYSIFKLEASVPGEPAKLTDALKADLKTALINQAVTQKLPELIAELRKQARIEVLK